MSFCSPSTGSGCRVAGTSANSPVWSISCLPVVAHDGYRIDPEHASHELSRLGGRVPAPEQAGDAYIPARDSLRMDLVTTRAPLALRVALRVLQAGAIAVVLA